MLYLFQNRESPKENKAFFFRTYGVLTPVECQLFIFVFCSLYITILSFILITEIVDRKVGVDATKDCRNA